MTAFRHFHWVFRTDRSDHSTPLCSSKTFRLATHRLKSLSTPGHIIRGDFHQFILLMGISILLFNSDKFLVFIRKLSVVLRRWESETWKFGFIKRVDKKSNYHRERFWKAELGKLTFRALALHESE